jgi:prepilin-type N-terminal cleavage/methylation domain-containing protein
VRRPTTWGRRVSAPRGFTLIETVLVLALLVLLAGLTISSFSGTSGQAGQEECVQRLAALCKSARAEAAGPGRRLRLSFPGGQPLLEAEADPLNKPGEFAPLDAWWADKATLDEPLRVSAVTLDGNAGLVAAQIQAQGGDGKPAAPAAQTPPTGQTSSAGQPQQSNSTSSAGQETLPYILFRPDGSNDGATVTISDPTSETPETAWTRQIRLSGVDGSIQILTPPDDEDTQASQ